MIRQSYTLHGQKRVVAIHMPDGYEAIVGARGVDLSGGQKQRLAIARALLTRPAILITNDSTSAVDVATAARI